jgi:hypothetical protein
MKDYIKNRLIGEIFTVAGIILIIICILLLSGCVTKRQIERNCDRFVDICKTDTRIEYRDTTIYFTDTVFYKLPPDTVSITDTLILYDNYCYLLPVQRSFGLINVLAGVDRSVLNVRAWLSDSTILMAKTDTVYIEKAVKKESEVIVVPERYVPGIYKFALYAMIGIILYMFIVVIRKLSF